MNKIQFLGSVFFIINHCLHTQANAFIGAEAFEIDVLYEIQDEGNSTEGTTKAKSYDEFGSVGINVAYRISTNHES